MPEPKSLSAKEITAAARGAVDRVLEQHQKVLPKVGFELGLVRPPWWFGIILRDRVTDLTLGQAEKLASDLAQGIAEKVPAARAAKPGVFIEDGITTIGFVPPLDINFIAE